MINEIFVIMSGKLETTPFLKEVRLPRPGYIALNSLIISVEDEKETSVPIVARDEIAEEMLRYKKGDEIRFLGTINDSIKNYDGTFLPALGYTVLAIDHNGEFTDEAREYLAALLEKRKAE